MCWNTKPKSYIPPSSFKVTQNTYFSFNFGNVQFINLNEIIVNLGNEGEIWIYQCLYLYLYIFRVNKGRDSVESR